MSDEHDIDGGPEPARDPLQDLAAEYVLGTLPADERRDAERLVATDEAFAAAVTAWEVRLAPLLDALPEQQPPEGVFFDVRQAIGGISHDTVPSPAPTADTESVLRFDRAERDMKRWRRVAIATGALAASLVAFVLFREVYEPSQRAGGSFVAVLESENRDPAFVAVIDTRTGAVAIRRIGAPAEAGKSHQLWALGGGRTAPESLGVIGRSSTAANTPVDANRRDALDGTVFAISLEPAGGSPTGQPTGPVMFTGKLIPAPDTGRPDLLKHLKRGW